jgi:hypothetical protein
MMFTCKDQKKRVVTCKWKREAHIWCHLQWTDSTPAPATNQRNMKVVAIPTLGLATTMHFNVDSCHLFPGICYLYIDRIKTTDV